jgi:hypothetical protein
MASNASKNFYQKLDEVFSALERFLNNFNESEILKKYSMEYFRAFFFATLINNFFSNLNAENVKELKLPGGGKIAQIRRTHKGLLKNVRLTLSSGQILVNKQSYNSFKDSLTKDYSGYEKILEEIERLVDFNNAERYLKEKEEAVTKLGKKRISGFSNDFLMTTFVEAYVETKKNLTTGKTFDNFIKKGLNSLIPELSKQLKESLDKESSEMLNFQRKQTSDYVSDLYKTWKSPLDKLECLIRVSFETGEKEVTKLRAMPDFKDNFKYAAFIKIHPRALHISNEILVLLKSGYPDGANSRWRSLHELAVISNLLYENGGDVSKRYLDHEIVRRFKEATDYQAECKGLGYEPLSRKEYKSLKKAKEAICAKYNDKFQDEYGWIPSSVLANRNFRSIEQHVKLNRFHPLYNLSCDAVHSGPKGFYRLGLTAKLQNNLLLTGPSIYGLADPIQNTAISLGQISACLLALTKDCENVIAMNVINMYCKEIGEEAFKVHQAIQKED